MNNSDDNDGSGDNSSTKQPMHKQHGGVKRERGRVTVEKKGLGQPQCEMMSLNECFRHRIIKIHSFQFGCSLVLALQCRPF